MYKRQNDILVHGKKLVGILTLMSASMEKIDYIIMGIGINTGIKKNRSEERSMVITGIFALFAAMTELELSLIHISIPLVRDYDYLYSSLFQREVIYGNFNRPRANQAAHQRLSLIHIYFS